MAIQWSYLLFNESWWVIMRDRSLGSNWLLARQIYRIYFSNTPFIRVLCVTLLKFIVGTALCYCQDVCCRDVNKDRLTMVKSTLEFRYLHFILCLMKKTWQYLQCNEAGMRVSILKTFMKVTRIKVVCGGNVGVGGGMGSERWIKRAIRHASELLRYNWVMLIMLIRG